MLSPLKQKILIIGPIPPPLTGNSLPIKTIVEGLKNDFDIETINLSKKNHVSGVDSFDRVVKIIKMLFLVFRKHKNFDMVYLSIAESLAGNFRDLIIYFICRRRLNQTTIHMFGGAGMKLILSNKKSFRYKLNQYFLSQLGGIIVEGKPQFEMFSKVAGSTRIHIVPNFAEDNLFIADDKVKKKFSENNLPLQILFLSNMLKGKGHFELLDSLDMIEDSTKSKLFLTFVGKLTNKNDEDNFYNKIKKYKNIVEYLGPLYGEAKREILSRSHIFCLPTYYPHEGQPFSIIEAYASGCVVITTNHSGIVHIFDNKKNGYFVDKKSPASIAYILNRIVLERDKLVEMASFNLEQSKRLYRSDRFINQIRTIFLQTLDAKNHL